jgi:hypothetical protein
MLSGYESAVLPVSPGTDLLDQQELDEAAPFAGQEGGALGLNGVPPSHVETFEQQVEE